MSPSQPARSGKKTQRRPAARTGHTKKTSKRSEDVCELRLYVAGQTPKSRAAIENLNRICEQHLAGRYTVEVVDLLKDPTLARGDQILAIPTLVRKLPVPMRKVIGDLSNIERVFVGLDLKPHGA